MREEAGDRFDYWWSNRGSLVDETNRRRGGESAVEVVTSNGETFYCKRQRGHLFRSLRYPLGRPTALREAIALSACRRLQIPVVEIQFSGVRHRDGAWQGLLVTRELAGYTHFDDWFALEHHRDPELDEQILKKMAALLIQFHRSRWQHGSLYPKHLFAKVVTTESGTDVSVLLLDLEKSRQRITSAVAARHDLRQLHRRWERIPGGYWQILFDHYMTLVSNRRREKLVAANLSNPGWAGAQ